MLMMKKLLPLFPLLLLVLILTACGGSSTPTTNASTTQNSAAPTATPTPTPQPTLKTASDVLTALKAKIPTIGETFTYNEDNDVNKLLGRPGQYTSKVVFKDTRVVRPYINDSGANIGVPDGGSIEAFDNVTDAQARFKYIQAISKSGGMFAEWEYIQGTVILRLSNDLTSPKAKEYETAFKAILQ